MKKLDKERLAAKRIALAAQLEKRKAAAQARIDALPGRKERESKQRRRTLLLILIVLILLLLLTNCCCLGPEPIGPVMEPELLPPAPVEEVVVEEPPKPIVGKVQRKKRPPYHNEPPKKLPWIASFRMQVAARSPRLAECFVGADKPGTLKWTTAVEPVEGRVSAHSLEPMLLSTELSKRDRACILEVLSSPPYKLEAGEERTTPARVGMVIEF